MIAIILLAAQITLAAPIAKPDIEACVGRPMAVDRAALESLRAAESPQEWSDDCRQARDADVRRLSLARRILATGQSPTPTLAGLAYWTRLAKGASDPDLADLYAHVARDQAARQMLSPAAMAFYAPGVSPTALRLLHGLISQDAAAADEVNRAWLKAAVARRGWFTLGRYGDGADAAAWLIVQHGDADRAFQKTMIDILLPLAKAGETSENRLAFLYDRWAAGAGEPQLYGLQGQCDAPGSWRPLPTADEAGLDARRRSAGLGPMAEATAAHARQCR